MGLQFQSARLLSRTNTSKAILEDTCGYPHSEEARTKVPKRLKLSPIEIAGGFSVPLPMISRRSQEARLFIGYQTKHSPHSQTVSLWVMSSR
jgi:hypothetical protein